MTPASTRRSPIVRLPAPCGISTNCSAPSKPRYGACTRTYISAAAAPMASNSRRMMNRSSFFTAFLRPRPVQIILQDDRRRGRVELFIAFAPVALADGQPALRLAARQALAFGRNRQRRARFERRDERDRARGLGAR